MIDYEKLKVAHALVKDLNGILCHEYNDRLKIHRFIFYPYAYSFSNICVDNLDQLISILKERTKLKCHPINEREPDSIFVDCIKCGQSYWELRQAMKYKVGDIVWRLNDEYYPHELKILQIYRDEDERLLFTDENGHHWLKHQLYPTRQDLIEDQLDYWTCLKEREKSICVHESTTPNHEDYLKCNKCGEMYR